MKRCKDSSELIIGILVNFKEDKEDFEKNPFYRIKVSDICEGQSYTRTPLCAFILQILGGQTETYLQNKTRIIDKCFYLQYLILHLASLTVSNGEKKFSRTHDLNNFTY